MYSYLMKTGDSPQKQAYRPHLADRLLAVSFITVGELLFGAYSNNWGQAKIRDLKQRLKSVVIVPYDLEVCSTYANLKYRLKRNCIADNDLWIAACAVRHGIPLVSNNRSHFERVPGIVLISEAPVVKEMTSQMTLTAPETTSASADPEPPASQ